MTTALTEKPAADLSVIEQVLMQGDLAPLKPAERVAYYDKVCETLGLNKYTKPFEYIILNGKLRLYATRDCTDQLRKRDKISVRGITTQQVGDVYIVTAVVETPEGRTDTSTGAVPLKGKVGDDLANALMKAETKAKRRATLSICGLGWLDETELETIKDKPARDTRSLREKVGVTVNVSQPEPAAPIHVEATPEHRALPDQSKSPLLYPFGKCKGQSITDVPDESLQYWMDRIEKDLADQAKKNFWAKGRKNLDELQVEMDRRVKEAFPESENPSAFATQEEFNDHMEPPAEDLTLQ